MDTLRQYNRIHIPPPPLDNSLINTWIKEITILAKTSDLQARKITTKYTKECIKKAISKYKKLYETNPKRINRKVFKNLETPLLDCITDSNNNILTNPDDIANEIHIQQTLSNKPTVPTCYNLVTTYQITPLSAYAQLDSTHGMT
jgi:DNA-binding protein Fis